MVALQNTIKIIDQSLESPATLPSLLPTMHWLTHLQLTFLSCVDKLHPQFKAQIWPIRFRLYISLDSKHFTAFVASAYVLRDTVTGASNRPLRKCVEMLTFCWGGAEDVYLWGWVMQRTHWSSSWILFDFCKFEKCNITSSIVVSYFQLYTIIIGTLQFEVIVILYLKLWCLIK